MSVLSNAIKTMSRKIARAEVTHLRHQSLALQTLYPHQEYTMRDVAGSTTLLSPAKWGSKLNHTYGFGMFGPVTNNDLHAIEDAYKQNGVRPEIYMCESADSSALDLLTDHYTITGHLCQYQMSLSDFDHPTMANDIDISIVASSDHEMFIQASIEGFRSNGRSEDLLRLLAESAAARPDTLLFSASMHSELLGVAGMAIVDVDDSKVAHLYIDSSLPRARGRGVHKALLLERLRIAKDRGCDLAIASAREGSISAHNIQKVGLEMAYACRIYTRDH